MQPSLKPAHFDCDVLIAGAGPVGTVLALDLASRGIRVRLLEQRAFHQPPSAKSNHVSSRSMEILRRLGISQLIRNAGLPADYPNDVAFRTTVTGLEMSRIPIPSREDRFTDSSGPDGWWPTPEPPHRINQIYLEPLLLQQAAQHPGITLMNRTRFEAFSQDDEGIIARITALDTGVSSELRAKYIVGCEGGRSEVRRAIGATFEGTPVVQRVQSTHIRKRGLKALVVR